jgi:hypothetical protein
MFVTKLLRTNSGQCHSLPLLYKMLADQLGVKTYISMAPNHTYIQVLDDRGELYSYETTTHRFVTDSYYMSTGYVKASALKSRSYLDTLTMKEVLASQLLIWACATSIAMGGMISCASAPCWACATIRKA